MFREFIELKAFARHSKSGMPLSVEYRAFVLDGRPVLTCNYCEEGEYVESAPDLEQFADVLPLISSRFFTMDVALRADGRWMIIELGDAQVSGLQTAGVHKFYEAMLRG